jgi:hypothetical protein
MIERLPSPLRILVYSVTAFTIAFVGMVFAYRSIMG